MVSGFLTLDNKDVKILRKYGVLNKAFKNFAA